MPHQKFRTECITYQMVHRNITMLRSIGVMASSSGCIMNSNNLMKMNRTSTSRHREGVKASDPASLAHAAQ